MPLLYRVITEICVRPGDFPGGVTNGFINVITRADSQEQACERLANYVGTFDWRIIEVDSAGQVDNLVECSQEMEEMIDRARDNPLAIILGTFHSYNVN